MSNFLARSERSTEIFAWVMETGKSATQAEVKQVVMSFNVQIGNFTCVVRSLARNEENDD